MSKNKKSFSPAKLGIIIMAISAVGMLFSVYLLIFGERTYADCTDIKSAKSKYVIVYTYNVDGKEYTTSERVDRKKLDDAEKEQKKVIYLKQAPLVTYDLDLLLLSGMSLVFGFGFYFAGSKRDKSQAAQ